MPGGALAKTQQALEELSVRNVASRNATIGGVAQRSHEQGALPCLNRVRHAPNVATFISALKACGKTRSLIKGKQIHEEIMNHGLFGKHLYLDNALVDMYVKCGLVTKAQQVLLDLPFTNKISWSTVIAGYVKQGNGAAALGCFEKMKIVGLNPDAITFTSILKACGSVGAVSKGEEIHDEISSKGFLEKDVFLGNALVDMYAKCGDLKKAQQVLDELHCRDTVSWTALISGYSTHGQGIKALESFMRMQSEGISPNEITFISVFKACGSTGSLRKGIQLHDEIVTKGLFGKVISLDNALVYMYAKCGALEKAKEVLNELPIRDIVSWSTLIAGYSNYGLGEEALRCFEQMQHEGFSPDEVTFISILKACGSVGAVRKGRSIHMDIVNKVSWGKNILLANALIDMYAKFGALSKVLELFDELPQRNVVSWNTLIAGYAHHGHGEEALKSFQHMQLEGLCPNVVTFTCILKACGNVGVIDKGKQIHDEIVCKGLLSNNISLGNALIVMYATCGALKQAQGTFDALLLRDTVSWSSLISGYAQQGQGDRALTCFRQMLQKGFAPNTIIFLSVLNACSHSGLVDEGQMFFEDMTENYGIVPDTEHQSCMINLFSRAGHFDKAIAVLIKMPSSDYPPIWDSLLGACRKWANVKLGRFAFEQAIKLDRNNHAAYICMTNIYLAADMQKAAETINFMRVKNLLDDQNMECGRM